MQHVLVLDATEVNRRRLSKGLLCRELAEVAGLHPNTLVKVMKARPIGVRAARQIADALGAPLEELVQTVLASDTEDSAAAKVAS